MLFRYLELNVGIIQPVVIQWVYGKSYRAGDSRAATLDLTSPSPDPDRETFCTIQLDQRCSKGHAFHVSLCICRVTGE